LIRCNIEGIEYTVFGYKGKQVRDNIHAYDVARFIDEFIAATRAGEGYNLGGGKGNSCAILEAFDLVARSTGKAQRWSYSDTARIGDHICYYSDLRQKKSHFPRVDHTRSVAQTVPAL